MEEEFAEKESGEENRQEEKKEGMVLKRFLTGTGIIFLFVLGAGIIFKGYNYVKEKKEGEIAVTPTVKKERKEKPSPKEEVNEELKEIEKEIEEIEKKATEIDFSEPVFSYPDLEMEIDFEDE